LTRDSGLEAKPLHDFTRGLFGVGIADMDRLAEIVAVDGIGNGSDQPFALALSHQVVRYFLTFGD